MLGCPLLLHKTHETMKSECGQCGNEYYVHNTFYMCAMQCGQCGNEYYVHKTFYMCASVHLVGLLCMHYAMYTIV